MEIKTKQPGSTCLSEKLKRFLSTVFGLTLILFCLTLVSAYSPSKAISTNEWTFLFDGTDLENWDTYLGPPIKEGVSSEDRSEQLALGLNNDTLGVFTIVELDGERVLRISGENWGGISTTREFENYHLQLEFRWGEQKWYPRDKPSDKRDSGLLYHAVGEHGEGDGFWLKSQEFQIQEGDAGDYWGVAGAFADIHASLIQDSVYQYNPKGPLLTFRENNGVGRYCKKFLDAEKPTGEWNTIDLYNLNGSSWHVVNGVLNMILQNSKQVDDGEVIPLTKGKIQLQSESAEIFYRNIKIRELDQLPNIR